ncbi:MULTISPECIES: hypothetical protein [Rhizobium/Agrobacterium group]|uniref:DUF2842 domain-containing protein n=1 Tax=Agrobacterium vitis TaxID=373 RepID=A0ABD6HFU4_AGRVI|nr:MULTISPECIES: hypothetical protein [Rhizobium/Agrobacterium group]MUO31498.1 hypothetical protein [Agrobacterium vitis]MUO45294.1 hypothetical protein [Agrobacterium vitis]MUP13216.1 hypothetical protein [Agrobacterium vitis]
MKISLKRKIGMTVLFVAVYLFVSVASGWVIGTGFLHAVACGLLAIPFAWMVSQTWSDD